LLKDAIYSNTKDTDFFLDKNKSTYIGGLLEMMNHRIYTFWGSLEEGLRTGKPQNEAKEGVNMFEVLYSDPKRLREFINAMSGIQMGNFMRFANTFDFSKYKTFADVGGASGLLSILVAQAHPHLACTSFDLPQVEPLAKERIAQYKAEDRVSVAVGNFFTDPLPQADVITMGNILHDWDEEKKIMLIQKAYDALPKGGAFIAIENVIDNDRKKNVFGLMMSINMLIETGDGFDYTFNDFNEWASKAGFSKTELIQLAGPSSAAVAYK
jgi:predicted O-methyltransferase YrrM